ncbi:MAG: ferritin-like domain-containing protein [Candidatus Nanopelagicales bacterium]
MPDPGGSFLVDVARLREQARTEIDRGPVTASYGADVDRVIGVLQEALATELVCTLRYRQHHHTARGMNAEPIAAEFLQHSVEELDHAERIASRIAQLGGEPDMDPSHLTGRSHSEYRTASTLREMIEENLVAERIAVASYTEVIAWLGTGDPTTRRLFEDILAVEEEHADDLVAMLDDAHDGGR